MDDKCQNSPIVSLEDLLQKKHTFVSDEEALRDVIPPQWSEDVLNGKAKIIV